MTERSLTDGASAMFCPACPDRPALNVRQGFLLTRSFRVILCFVGKGGEKMERKLWIILALAVLITTLWCGTAGAEYDYVNGVKYTFEIYDMPVSEFGVLTLSLDPDQTKEIKFRSENFTPTRIEVWTHDSPVTVIKKMITLPGTATSFGIPYYYGEYVDLVAYYGDGDNE